MTDARLIRLAILFGIPPWEFEEQISSEWLTRMEAFENEFTLDPTAWRRTATICTMQALAAGVKNAKPDDFIPRVEYKTQEERDEEMLQRALARFPRASSP